MSKNDELPPEMMTSRKTLGKKYDKIPESFRPEESQELGYKSDFEAVKALLTHSRYDQRDLGDAGEAYLLDDGAVFLQEIGPIERVVYVGGVKEEKIEETAENLYDRNGTSFDKILDQGLSDDIDPDKIKEKL